MCYNGCYYQKVGEETCSMDRYVSASHCMNGAIKSACFKMIDILLHKGPLTTKEAIKLRAMINSPDMENTILAQTILLNYDKREVTEDIK